MTAIVIILILLLFGAALILAHNFGYDKGYHDGYEDGDYEGYRCGLDDSSRLIEKFCDKITKKKTAASE